MPRFPAGNRHLFGNYFWQSITMNRTEASKLRAPLRPPAIRDNSRNSRKTVSLRNKKLPNEPILAFKLRLINQPLTRNHVHSSPKNEPIFWSLGQGEFPHSDLRPPTSDLRPPPSAFRLPPPPSRSRKCRIPPSGSDILLKP